MAWAVALGAALALLASGASPLTGDATIPGREDAPAPRLLDGHPRVLFVGSELPRYRSLARHGLHQQLLGVIRTELDRHISTSPPPQPPGRGGSFDWEEFQAYYNGPASGYATFITNYSFGFLVTGRPEYRDRARAWLLALVSWPRWKPSFEGGESLFEASSLKAVALGYDMLYAELTRAERRTVRTRLAERVETLLQQDRYWSNHAWIEMAAIGIAAMAIYDEHPSAPSWADRVATEFRRLATTAGFDEGDYFEGPGFWAWMLVNVSMFSVAYQRATGVDLFDEAEPLRRAGDYLVHALPPPTPRKYWSQETSWEPGYGRSYFPTRGAPFPLMFRYATAFRDPHAQWRALRDVRGLLDPCETPPSESLELFCPRLSDEVQLLSFLWYDPDVRPVEPTSTSRHFAQSGLVTMRSGWSPVDEVLVSFYSGLWTGPHSGLAQNHFSIFAHGQNLTEEFYDDYNFSTEASNAVLADGRDQRGGRWDLPFRNVRELAEVNRLGLIREFFGSTVLDYSVGEAVRAYPGLSRARRHLAFLKPNVVVVYDELNASSASPFHWILHTTGRMRVGGRRAEIDRRGVGLVLDSLLPADARLERADTIDLVSRLGLRSRYQELWGHPGNPWRLGAYTADPYLRVVSGAASRTRFLTVLAVYPDGASRDLRTILLSGEPAPAVRIESAGLVHELKIHGEEPLSPPTESDAALTVVSRMAGSPTSWGAIRAVRLREGTTSFLEASRPVSAAAATQRGHTTVTVSVPGGEPADVRISSPDGRSSIHRVLCAGTYRFEF